MSRGSGKACSCRVTLVTLHQMSSVTSLMQGAHGTGVKASIFYNSCFTMEAPRPIQQFTWVPACPRKQGMRSVAVNDKGGSIHMHELAGQCIPSHGAQRGTRAKCSFTVNV